MSHALPSPRLPARLRPHSHALARALARTLPLAVALALSAAPAQASVTTSSAVSDSVEVSARSITQSIKRASDSSSGRPLAQGDYRITQVAVVAPELQEVTLQAIPGTGARGELVLHMPGRAVQAGGVAVGQRVTARARPYGYELARTDTQQAFFLLLDDPWYKELQSVIVRL